MEGMAAKFDEVVIFQEEHVLPKFIIHITPIGGGAPSYSVVQPNSLPIQREIEPATSTSNSVEDVSSWLRNLKLSRDYGPKIDGQVDSRALATMKEEDRKRLVIEDKSEILL